MPDFKVGVVTHYYAKLGIAIVDLTSPLYVGDKIRITGSLDFSQHVQAIYVEDEQVKSAAAGDTVGIKTLHSILPGDEILKTL